MYGVSGDGGIGRKSTCIGVAIPVHSKGKKNFFKTLLHHLAPAKTRSPEFWGFYRQSPAKKFPLLRRRGLMFFSLPYNFPVRGIVRWIFGEGLVRIGVGLRSRCRIRLRPPKLTGASAVQNTGKACIKRSCDVVFKYPPVISTRNMQNNMGKKDGTGFEGKCWLLLSAPAKTR